MLLMLLLSVIHKTGGEWVEIVQTVAPPKRVGVSPKPNYKTLVKSIINENEFTTSLSPTSIPVAPLNFNKSTTKEATLNVNNNQIDNENGDEGFLGLIKTVQNKLIKKPHQNKISVLKNLRNNLLNEISDRINNLFGNVHERQARGIEDEHDMHFPSNEGALMTIGFLTFAVFLIKLVLKLIYALKNKNAQTVTIPTMSGATATTFIGRKRRDTNINKLNDEDIKILQLIEEFN